jgi:hypothetical protein
MSGKAPHPFFGPFNALVAKGWIARLKPTEVKVLWCYFSHFNSEDGVTWPGNECIARELDIDERDVRRAKSALVKLGILVPVEAGGGRQRTTRFRLEAPPRQARGNPGEIPPGEIPPGENSPGGNSAPIPGGISPENPGEIPPPNILGTTEEEHLTPQPPHAGEAGVVIEHKPRGKSKAEPRPEIKVLIDHFHAGYVARFGRGPSMPRGRVGAIMAAVLDHAGGGIDGAKGIIDAYLVLDDAWIAKKRHAVTFLTLRLDECSAPVPHHGAREDAEEGDDGKLAPITDAIWQAAYGSPAPEEAAA